MRQIIGVDFDNTLVTYDKLIHSVALERGLIGSRTVKSKKHTRDSIRELPGGEIEWQRVQALVYGPRMMEANPARGAAEFLRTCARHRIKVRIVSHKTELANYDDTGTNLRAAALAWMDRHRLFDTKVVGLSLEDVFFEPTRRDKLERIRQLGCTHFIDDLEETFLEESFPARVEKILYTSRAGDPVRPRVALAGDWRRITDYFFHAAD